MNNKIMKIITIIFQHLIFIQRNIFFSFYFFDDEAQSWHLNFDDDDEKIKITKSKITRY